MGRIADFKALVKSGKPLSGTFLKTPHHNMIEVMAQSGLDFVCLDAEHAPFDRAAIDACLAVSRALDYPVLVRVGDSSPVSYTHLRAHETSLPSRMPSSA